jgi:hypothetical protein
MFQFKKLAIAGAITASLMGATAAQAHVSYHISSTGGEAPNVNGTGTITTGSWTGGSPVAKGYVGNLPATWLANIHHTGDVYEVSKADAIAESASVNASTFKLESISNKWNPLHSWGNALDFGLIDLDVAGNVTIKVQAESGSLFNPGFTLFQGWDTASTSNKHTSWNVNPVAPSSSNPTSGAAANTNPTLQPLRTLGLSYIGHASTSSSDGGVDYSYDSVAKAVEITFNGLSAGKYSLWIGGNNTGPGIGGAAATCTGCTGTTNQQYLANISVAAVPVPGAVWLFGTAMAGMVGIGRRKAAISA